jgi:large subunit ribosomal protein L24
MSKWIKKDDKVKVLAGNDKDKIGLVLARNKEKVIVQGVNIRKKHVKKTQAAQASIVEMEMPIHISNVAIVGSDEKPIKVRVKYENSEKKLVYLENGKETVLRTVKKK